MRKHLIDHAERERRGERLKAFAGIERRSGGPMAPFFENVFRRARNRSTHERLTQYLAIARRS